MVSSHDSSSAYRSVLLKDFFLAKYGVSNSGPTPTERASIVVCLLLRLKSALNERRFCDATDIIQNAAEEPKRLSQNGFHECFQHLFRHW